MDSSISIWLNELARHDGLRPLAVAGASVLLLAPAIVVAFLAVRALWRHQADAVASLLIAGAGTAIALGLNVAATGTWRRVRPYHALSQVQALIDPTSESSFFSDHTVVVTGLAVGALLVSRRWGLIAALAALLVAVARVAVGAHYPSDVLAAAAITALAIAVLLPVRRPLARWIAPVLDRLPPRPRGAMVTTERP